MVSQMHGWMDEWMDACKFAIQEGWMGGWISVSLR